MRGDVAGDDAREQVIAAARRGADDEPHLLAAIEGRDVVLRVGRPEQTESSEEQDEQTMDHRVAPAARRYRRFARMPMRSSRGSTSSQKYGSSLR